MNASDAITNLSSQPRTANASSIEYALSTWVSGTISICIVSLNIVVLAYVIRQLKQSTGWERELFNQLICINVTDCISGVYLIFVSAIPVNNKVTTIACAVAVMILVAMNCISQINIFTISIMRYYSARRAIYAVGYTMARSKLLIGLNLWIGVMVLVYSIITMEVRYPPRDDLCYMANVIELNSYKTVMTIISISNVSCLLGSDIVNILAFVSLNKALRTVQPSIDPVQREATGETYQVHKAIFRTLIIVLIMYHLSVAPITIGSIFASLTKKALPNIVTRILGLASCLNLLTSPVIIMSRNAKIKRSIVDDVQNLKRALWYRADS